MADNGFRGLRITNTLTRRKEDFVPADPDNVRMYVCGPTVYDYAHIGNARPAIVFDVLFRLLRHLYGPQHVTYVRNITDVDDKINARALRDFGAEIDAGRMTLNEAIRQVTGAAGPTQVEGATTAMVSGFGMINYDRGVCSSAAIISGAGA